MRIFDFNCLYHARYEPIVRHHQLWTVLTSVRMICFQLVTSNRTLKPRFHRIHLQCTPQKHSQLITMTLRTTPSLQITQNKNDSDASSRNTTRPNPSHWPHVTRLTPLAQMRAQNTFACHREKYHIAIPTHSTKKKDSAVQRNFKACLLSHHLLNIKYRIEK